MQLFITAIMPVGSSMLSNFTVTWVTIFSITQFFTASITVFHKLVNCSWIFSQIAAMPLSCTSFIKVQMPSSVLIIPLNLATLCGPMRGCAASFSHIFSMVRPSTSSTQLITPRNEKSVSSGIPASRNSLINQPTTPFIRWVTILSKNWMKPCLIALNRFFRNPIGSRLMLWNAANVRAIMLLIRSNGKFIISRITTTTIFTISTTKAINLPMGSPNVAMIRWNAAIGWIRSLMLKLFHKSMNNCTIAAGVMFNRSTAASMRCVARAILPDSFICWNCSSPPSIRLMNPWMIFSVFRSTTASVNGSFPIITVTRKYPLVSLAQALSLTISTSLMNFRMMTAVSAINCNTSVTGPANVLYISLNLSIGCIKASIETTLQIRLKLFVIVCSKLPNTLIPRSIQSAAFWKVPVSCICVRCCMPTSPPSSSMPLKMVEPFRSTSTPVIGSSPKITVSKG